MLGFKVFSDSKASQRAVLGERVTGWLRANPGIELCDLLGVLLSDGGAA